MTDFNLDFRRDSPLYGGRVPIVKPRITAEPKPRLKPRHEFWGQEVFGVPLDQFVETAGIIAKAFAPREWSGQLGEGLSELARRGYEERLAREAPERRLAEARLGAIEGLPPEQRREFLLTGEIPDWLRAIEERARIYRDIEERQRAQQRGLPTYPIEDIKARIWQDVYGEDIPPAPPAVPEAPPPAPPEIPRTRAQQAEDIMARWRARDEAEAPQAGVPTMRELLQLKVLGTPPAFMPEHYQDATLEYERRLAEARETASERRYRETATEYTRMKTALLPQELAQKQRATAAATAEKIEDYLLKLDEAQRKFINDIMTDYRATANKVLTSLTSPYGITSETRFAALSGLVSNATHNLMRFRTETSSALSNPAGEGILANALNTLANEIITTRDKVLQAKLATQMVKLLNSVQPMNEYEIEVGTRLVRQTNETLSVLGPEVNLKTLSEKAPEHLKTEGARFGRVGEWLRGLLGGGQ
ncbi:MAG: hypothetical protein DDT19_01891 [Syntrophomonadaceae bacterium]|nr:hypothetical protein [Bacillota bacterium]